MIEDEVVGWPHRLNGHDFEYTPGVGDGQEGLACCSHIYSGQGQKSPRKCSNWELEHRAWRAIPGQALLLTAGRQPKGIVGGDAVGNVCEGKPSKHGVRVILLSHTQETEPSP